MKILWVVNVILPRIEKLQNINSECIYGGWLSGLSDNLLNTENIDLCVCYPQNVQNEMMYGKKENFSYYGFSLKGDYCNQFNEILNNYKPDVIHFFGTEFNWSYNLLQVCKSDYINNTIISIQGLVSVCSRYFFTEIPFKWKYIATLSEIKSKTTLKQIYKDYLKRGFSEIKELEMAKNIIGRTTWDKACTLGINPKLNYYFCNETLRKEFYSGRWEYEKCNKHTIYVSQATKPMKGFHVLLKSLQIVIRKYPDTIVYVAGPNVTSGNFIKGSTYGNYLRKQIKNLGFTNNIKFLGNLQAIDVKNNLLKSNIFVSPSAIENSPNSLGEAMLLGVPCISSNVGGVSDMLIHNEEGFIYPYDEHELLSYYIIKLFEDTQIANLFSEKARSHARKTHDSIVNNNKLLEIYKDIRKEEQC